MKLLEIPIQIYSQQMKKTTVEKGAFLTCYLKDNTAGRPMARRKAVIICPGGGYEFCSTREGRTGGYAIFGYGLSGVCASLQHGPQPFSGGFDGAGISG